MGGSWQVGVKRVINALGTGTGQATSQAVPVNVPRMALGGPQASEHGLWLQPPTGTGAWGTGAR